MKIREKHILITGGASGIGAAMAQRFAADGAASIGIADVDYLAAQALAERLGGQHQVKAAAYAVDVTRAEEVENTIHRFERECGPLDLMCSNAGVLLAGDTDLDDHNWQVNWDVNVMGNVHVARAVVPLMLARGHGYFLVTCSAAGLLANPNAPYMVTKHAAVAFAEWLAIQYRSRGIRVSALCPRAVRTPMLERVAQKEPATMSAVLTGGDVVELDDLARCVVEGLAAERFLILPHETVRQRIVDKAQDRDAWIGSTERQFGIPSLLEDAPGMVKPGNKR